MDAIKTRITPAMARDLLAGQDVSHVNRSVSRNLVEKITSDISAGRWVFTGEPIILDGHNVLNGQHRLHAIIKADRAVDALIVRGIEPSAMGVMDSGRARSAKDVAGMAGIQSATRRIAIVRKIQAMIEGSVHRHPLSNSAVMEMLERWATDIDWATPFIHQSGLRKCSATFTGAFVFARRSNPSLVDELALQFFKEVGLQSGTPMYALHRYSQSDVAKGELRHDSVLDGTFKALIALKAAFDGRPLQKIYTKSGANGEEAREYFARKWVSA